MIFYVWGLNNRRFFLISCNDSRRTTNKNRGIPLLRSMQKQFTFDSSNTEKDQIIKSDPSKRKTRPNYL
jgi:hypothetical protein